MEENYYQILGVDEDSTKDQIKEAHAVKVMAYNPLRHNDDGEVTKKEFERVYAKVQEAYSILIDEEKRRAYDQKLRMSRKDSAGLKRKLEEAQKDCAEAKNAAIKAGKERDSAIERNSALEAELSNSEARRQMNTRKSLIACVSAVVIVALAIIIAISGTHDEFNAYVAERPVAVQDTVNIEGIYSLKKTTGDIFSVSTVEITAIEGGYTMTVYSDYLPCSANCRMTSDGILHSDLWGDGQITYRQSDGTIHIKYELRDNTLCELSK